MCSSSFLSWSRTSSRSSYWKLSVILFYRYTLLSFILHFFTLFGLFFYHRFLKMYIIFIINSIIMYWICVIPLQLCYMFFCNNILVKIINYFCFLYFINFSIIICSFLLLNSFLRYNIFSSFIVFTFNQLIIILLPVYYFLYYFHIIPTVFCWLFLDLNGRI